MENFNKTLLKIGYFLEERFVVEVWTSAGVGKTIAYLNLCNLIQLLAGVQVFQSFFAV